MASALALGCWLALTTTARGQQPLRPPPGAADGLQRRLVRLELPGPDELFRLQSEATLFERMKQEARQDGIRLTFPEEPVLSTRPYYGRNWPTQAMTVEPGYVCHRRLGFEQINAERYGWDFGIFHPAFSALVFYKDVVTLPYHRATQPRRKYECSAGKCLPGDPVPLLIYPPELSLTGLLAEAGAVGLLQFVFP